ncbi:hypothetical protein FLONG3_5289 [Fusarium longipes]|uniref:Uncharacterized protein n=1 Tax=Fusarium longipes TaxID=694270 RepID=A0A395SWU4_9HYPO|nr:hypothetical protein FLONG3_5289 [Fusarium longipes]
MDTNGESCHHSQTSIGLNTVEDLAQHPEIHTPGPEPGQRRKPGRPPGSKNRTRNMSPTTEGLALRNRTVFVPWNAVDLSDSGEDEESGKVNLEGSSEWEDDTSNSENKYESKMIAGQRKAFLKGVQKMTRLMEDKEHITKTTAKTGSLRSSSPVLRRTAVWNQVKEMELNDLWEHSLEKEAIERRSVRVNGLLTVWKMSLQLFEIDPLTLISMYQHMEFDNHSNDCSEHDEEMKCNPLWTHDFCKKLEHIMVHPLFANGNDYRLIPIFIRWAAICRTGGVHSFTEKEQRILDDTHCGDFRPSVKSESMVEQFNSYQQKRKNEGRITSRQAQLMSRIVEYSKSIAKESPKSFASVKTRDLTVLVKALDNLDPNTINVPCETYFLVYSASKRSRGYPVGLSELLEAYKTSWINLQRQKMSDYTQVVVTKTLIHQANAPVVEESKECNADKPRDRTIETVDHEGDTDLKVNNSNCEPGGCTFQDTIDLDGHSPSTVEDGEIIEVLEAPSLDYTYGDYLHESRRAPVENRHDLDALARNALLRLPDITTITPCGKDTAINHADIPSVPRPANEAKDTEAEVPEMSTILPFTRDPYRDPKGFYENGRCGGGTTGYVNVDELSNGINGNKKDCQETSRIARYDGSANRLGEPMAFTGRFGSSDSSEIREAGPSKRRKVQVGNWDRGRWNGGRNSTNARRDVRQPVRSQAPRFLPPAGPKAWQLEEELKRKLRRNGGRLDLAHQ